MTEKMFFIAYLVLGLVFLLPQPARSDLTLYASDDTWVAMSAPNTNKDGNALLVDYSDLPNCVYTRLAYLRFDIAPLYKDLGPATRFRVYVYLPPKSAGALSVWSTGDDWNGAISGLGDETTITWNNRPALVANLDTGDVDIVSGWVQFSSLALANYLNGERSANGGDGLAPFAIRWDGCAGELADSVSFEDNENFGGAGNRPEIVPLDPTAVTMKSFSAVSNEAGSHGVLLVLWICGFIFMACYKVIGKNPLA